MIRILAVLDTYPALSETFLYTLLENLSGAGLKIVVRARRRGKSPHRLALQVKYLPSKDWHISIKVILLGWYALRLWLTSPRAFLNAIRYLQKQSGGMRARSVIAYRVFPLLCEKVNLVYFSFGGLAVKYVDYFSLSPNAFFSLRGSDINIEPLLDAKYAEALTTALQKARKVHCVSRDIQQKAIHMSGQDAGKFQVIHTAVNPIFFQEDATTELWFSQSRENLNANDANSLMTRMEKEKFAEFAHSRYSYSKTADLPKSFEMAVSESSAEIKIVSTGRLDWRKGFEHGMMAVRELIERGVACSWTIIGEGPYRVALEWAARDMDLSGHVTFLGGKSQNEIAQIYRDAHIYFHPCLAEGFSNTVLEAMAMGLPVVVSNVGGMPEAVEHGKHGFLVGPRDWRNMADALEQLARDARLQESMSLACREKARAGFTPEKQAAGFKTFFGLST